MKLKLVDWMGIATIVAIVCVPLWLLTSFPPKPLAELVSDEKPRLRLTVDPAMAFAGAPLDMVLHVTASKTAAVGTVTIDGGDLFFTQSTFELTRNEPLTKNFHYPRIPAGVGEEGTVIITVVIYSDVGPIASLERTINRRAHD